MMRVAMLLLFIAGTARAAEQPVFTAAPAGVVTVALPASVLHSDEVRRRLGGGLTTTIVVLARELDDDVSGGARIEIRYDLWDEVYLVRRIDFDRHVEQARIAVAELERWWRSAALRVLATTRERVRLQLDVSVLPFSAAEQQDARQWLTKSGGVAPARAGSSSGGTGVVDALIGTTISAKPLITWRWTTEFAMK
jgi:hypothetical protein